MAQNLSPNRSAELVALSWLLADRLGLALAIPEPDWDTLAPRQVLREATRHRVVGLVVTAPRADLLPPNVREGLATAHRDATLRAMTQAADLRALLDHFADARIPVLMMKGQAFSAAVYGDWAVRGVSADADFLVPPQRLEAAHAVLTRLGYTSSLDHGRKPPLAGWVGRYNRWLHYERGYSAPNKLRIDLHWRPLPGSAPWTRFESMWERRTAIELHGRPVAMTGPADSLRIAAGQAEPDGWPTLRAACDVIGAAGLLSSDHLDSLVSSDRLVAAAIRHAPEIFRLGNPRWGEGPSARHDALWRQWVLRTRTDTISRAVTRSAFGMWLPARRFASKAAVPHQPHARHE